MGDVNPGQRKLKSLYRMPYHILHTAQGYYVMDENGHKFSKEPLSKMMAERQMKALNIAHARKMGYTTSLPVKKL